jgi:hypothetical protein
MTYILRALDWVVTAFFAIDFFFNFFQEYMDPETFVKVRSIK